MDRNPINPVSILSHHFLKNHFNIVLPSIPSSPTWLHPFRFSAQTSICVYLPCVLYVRPISPPPSDCPNNSCFKVRIMGRSRPLP